MQKHEHMAAKIRKHFKKEGLPTPVTIKYIGQWAKGECFAVTCGLFRLKKYCVYFIKGTIHSVRRR